MSFSPRRIASFAPAGSRAGRATPSTAEMYHRLGGKREHRGSLTSQTSLHRGTFQNHGESYPGQGRISTAPPKESTAVGLIRGLGREHAGAQEERASRSGQGVHRNEERWLVEEETGSDLRFSWRVCFGFVDVDPMTRALWSARPEAALRKSPSWGN